MDPSSPARRRRRFPRWALGGVALFLALQLWPTERTNPPVQAEIEAPAAIAGTLRRACYDCHSNETRWPWYAYVAPASWLIAHDVSEGRRHLNFSSWRDYPEARRESLEDEIAELVRSGEMPLSSYTLIHPSARLTEDEIAAIERWAQD